MIADAMKKVGSEGATARFTRPAGQAAARWSFPPLKSMVPGLVSKSQFLSFQLR
jgi:hypothetical protein